MIELLGLTGGLALAVCALPQTLHSYKHQTAEGLAWGFLSLWLLGELCSLGYALLALDMNAHLILNYSMNILCISTLTLIKLKEALK